MNDVIAELKRQADIWCDQNHPNHLFYDVLWEEKFAELIVKECSNVCLSMSLIGPHKDLQDGTLKDAAVKIKEHFGIEK
jgi:hypothetical protein